MYVLEADYQLIAVLKNIGHEKAVDMDDAAQRTSLEVCAVLMAAGYMAVPALLHLCITCIGGAHLCIIHLAYHGYLPLISGCNRRTAARCWHARSEMQQGGALRILLGCRDFSARFSLTTRQDNLGAALQLPARLSIGHWTSWLWQDLWLHRVSGPPC